MKFSQPLSMVIDFLESAMEHDFGIEGPVAREVDISGAFALRFGFLGDEGFDNRSYLDFFCGALERAAQTLNAAHSKKTGDETLIRFDHAAGMVVTQEVENFLPLLETLVEQQGLDRKSPAAASLLNTAFRETAQSHLDRDPKILLHLVNGPRGYAGRDALYAEILGGGQPGRFSLDDIRGALRAEDIVRRQAVSTNAPTFWYH